MTVRVRQWWENITASYWFIPMLLGLGAVGLSALTLSIDEAVRAGALVDFRFITLNGPDGARALLSTVAGSIITVAGVVFSLTMVVLTQASNQFGPRLLVNFMRDRPNQFVLGTFVATFLYSLLVLRVVRVGNDDLGLSEVVPHISVGVTLLLTFINVAVLVFFFHHTAESVRVSHVLADISRVMERRIQQATVAVDEAEEPPLLLPAFDRDLAVLDAPEGGVLQSVDVDRLVAFAREHDAVIRLLHAPGDFVLKGGSYAEIHPASAAPHVEEGLAEHLSLGEDRSLSQDLGFLFDELLEVALRALSPSMNDPFTAMNCVDRITQGLLLLDGRRTPNETHADEDGVTRAVVPLQSRGVLARHLFSELRAHVAGDLMTTGHTLHMLRVLAREVVDTTLERVAEEEIEALLAEAERSFSERDMARLRTPNDPNLSA
jgi:uncharacterized membrane protein